MSREQDAAIAEWMGWTWWHCPGPGDWHKNWKSGDSVYVPPGVSNYWEEAGWLPGKVTPFGDYEKRISRYSTDRNAMAEAEALLPERGLVTEYMFALCDICVGKQSFTFRVATATAPQRAEALVRVIEEGD